MRQANVLGAPSVEEKTGVNVRRDAKKVKIELRDCIKTASNKAELRSVQSGAKASRLGRQQRLELSSFRNIQIQKWV